MAFRDLDPDSVEALERKGQIAECRYYGFKDPAYSLKCKNCGAPLKISEAVFHVHFASRQNHHLATYCVCIV